MPEPDLDLRSPVGLGERRPSGRGHQALSGVLWTGLGYGAQGLSQLLLLVVLGRLLTPADFGVVTATLVIVNLGRLCTQAVVGAAIVQRPVLSEGHVRAAFTLAVLTGMAAAGLMVAIGPVAASFFSMPRLEAIIRALSVLFLLQCVSIVAQGLLERELRFRAVAAAEGAGHVVGLAGAGVVAGVLGAGVWSLVIGYIGLGVVQTAVILSLRRHPALPRFNRRELAEMLYFGGGFLGGRFFNYLALQGDNLVVARALGAGALGAYGRAYQLVAMPAMLIGQVLDRVLFPLFSRSQGERDELATDYGRGLSLVLAAAAPASVVACVAAPEIVFVVLGEGWAQVTWPLRILALGLLARTAYKVSDTLSRAVGVVYARAARQLAYATSVLVGAGVGQAWGINGVAAGVTVAIGVNHLLMAELCLRSVPLGWAAFVRLHVRAGLFAGALAVPALLVRAALAGSVPDLVTLAAVALATGGAVLVLTFAVPMRATAELRWLGRTLRSWSRHRTDTEART